MYREHYSIALFWVYVLSQFLCLWAAYHWKPLNIFWETEISKAIDKFSVKSETLMEEILNYLLY